MNIHDEIDRIYYLATNTNEEYTEFGHKRLSLINIRDIALDGGYEYDQEVYKIMIAHALLEME